MSDSTLFDAYNAAYVQELFERFSLNPSSVPESWRPLFENGGRAAIEQGLLIPEGMNGNGTLGTLTHAAPPPGRAVAESAGARAATDARPAGIAGEELRRLLETAARAAGYIQAIRDHGHTLAQTDPLGSTPSGHPELEPAFFGLSEAELAALPASAVIAGAGNESLAAAIERLRAVYTGSIGFQFEHLEDSARVQWLREQVESGAHLTPLPAETRIAVLRRLSQVEGLERFLHKAYLGQKRFSIEGTDMMVPMLDLAFERAQAAGAKEAMIGMAHRGRLNVLVHSAGIPYEGLLGEFEGGKRVMMAVPEPGTGDVKYHHGAHCDFPLPNGSTIAVTLAPNPSHLEFVNAVVAGMARHQQFDDAGKDSEWRFERVLPIQIHGDAAFAGEGVVPETLNMGRLPGYSTGGAVHIIANNQVGFTTDPDDARSTRYSSDVARGFDIPVLHVNADDPEACLAAMALAVDYRHRFQDDVVIDLVGYRRHGHNESDEPGYTQPVLYAQIDRHPTVRKIWADRLVAAGNLTEDQAAALEEEVLTRLREAQDAVKGEEGDAVKPEAATGGEPDPATGLAMAQLEELNALLLAVPDGFTIHPKLRRQLERRGKDFGPEAKMEWAHAESLALAGLIREGIPVRFTGQDVRRGTFSHRHLVLRDAQTGTAHAPIADIGPARFEIYNSPLTETAVLAYEYGYSVVGEDALVLWEAQFGDFVNVGQVILDQFLAAGQAKWGQLCGLTLLLPHGHEGQGPEHSSARLERFLQLCAEDNIRVAYPSTPGQYFHLLRRQALARPRRPLVVMTPKSLLRHPLATSTPTELAEGRFEAVLDDPSAEGRREEVTRLALCSGKVYYDLWAHEEREAKRDLALARLEQLYPFPAAEVGELLARYPNLKQVVWTQEEPRNMGALTWVAPQLRAVVDPSIGLSYVSRPERASPAEGKTKAHNKEQSRIADEVIRGG